MAELTLTLATGEHERARPLADGRVKPEGITLRTTMISDDGARHDRFLGGEFDACELSFAIYISRWESGADFAAIPVFFNRRFRHSFIYVNPGAGIRSAKDLEGKRFGISSWLNTASVWARGLLQHDYGVDLKSITWVTASAHDEPGWQPPAGFNLTPRPRRAPLPELLEQGEIDALVVPAVISGNPRIARLFPNFQDVEKDYYRRTGVFPISHTVVVRKAILDEHPWVAASLLNAAEQAKRAGYEYTSDPGHSNLAWYGAYMEAEREVFGDDAWPYGIEANRKPLEAFVGYAFEQGLAKTRPAIEELFHSSIRQTAALPA